VDNVRFSCGREGEREENKNAFEEN